MKKRFSTNLALASLLLSSLLLLSSMPVFAQSGFTLSPIVKRFEPAPDGGAFFHCDDCSGIISSPRAFNNRGDLIIKAETFGFCFDGIFLISGESGNKTLLSDSCRQTPWGRLYASDFSLNDQGQMVFRAYKYENDQNFDFLFLYNQGEWKLLAQDGMTAPDGTTFSKGNFADPHINNSGTVSFEGFSKDAQGNEGANIYIYMGTEIRSLVASGSPSPITGEFNFLRSDASPQINAAGNVLFRSSILNGADFTSKSGLFLITSEGIKKIVVSDEKLPTGINSTFMTGTLNDKGECAFSNSDSSIFFEDPDSIYLYSEGQIHQIMLQGDSTPVGGKFAAFEKAHEFYPQPALNNNSAVAFKAAVNKGNTPLAIFLASPKAIVKVVAVGDKVNDEEIADIGTYALNDVGQIAFFALDKQGKTLGVFKATPVTPEITSLKIKHKKGGLELRVTGNGFITNDSLIEINGVTLEAMSYPEEAREDGGTTRQIISRDARLEQLLTPGQAAQIKVFNSLTNRRSEAREFTR